MGKPATQLTRSERPISTSCTYVALVSLLRDHLQSMREEGGEDVHAVLDSLEAAGSGCPVVRPRETWHTMHHYRPVPSPDSSQVDAQGDTEKLNGSYGVTDRISELLEPRI